MFSQSSIFNHMAKTDSRLKYAYGLIHEAIHNREVKEVEIDGKKVPIKSWGGLRQVGYDGINFIEQNPNKDSAYGRLARDGAHITWGIVVDGQWLYIDDSVVLKLKERQEKVTALLHK